MIWGAKTSFQPEPTVPLTYLTVSRNKRSSDCAGAHGLLCRSTCAFEPCPGINFPCWTVSAGKLASGGVTFGATGFPRQACHVVTHTREPPDHHLQPDQPDSIPRSPQVYLGHMLHVSLHRENQGSLAKVEIFPVSFITSKFQVS